MATPDPVPVALLGRADDARARLREALTEFGAHIVFEGDPLQVDAGTLLAQRPRVVLLNLEAGVEDALDHLDALFDDPALSVVFNEADTSTALTGWDLSRWARHLAAKVLGRRDTDPPRPEGAEPVPGQVPTLQPGAPVSPAQLEAHRDIAEFTHEAAQVASDVPVQAEAGDPTAATPEPDGWALEDGMLDIEAVAAPTVLPTSVPDATVSDADAPDQLDYAFDLEALDAALQSDAAPSATGTSDADLIAAALADLDLDDVATPGRPQPPRADAAPASGFNADDVETADTLDIDLSAFDLPSEPVFEPAEDSSASDAELLAAALDGFDLDELDAPPVRRPVADEPGESLSLDDDPELARLAAQLDAQLDEAPADVVVLDAPFARPDAPAARAPDTVAAPAPPAAESRTASEPRPTFDFSALSLAPMDDDDAPAAEPAVADVAKPAAAKPAATSTYDFSGLGLSLEPMDGEDAGAAAGAGESLRRVVVLGASIGGPDALRAFLAELPPGFPALFLLAQHLDNGFFARLAEQLQKVSKLPVRMADNGAQAALGEVLVVGADTRLRLSADGRIALDAHAHRPPYSPSIDQVLRDVADVFGERATAIIFSGMAGDAIEGSVYLADKGGEVWAQDPSSCVVSSMVDGARARGVVEFIGSPRELARRCIEHYGAG